MIERIIPTQRTRNLLCCLLLTIPGWLVSQPESSRHLVTILSSRFQIHGQTNVNHFDCNLFENLAKDTVRVLSTWSDYRIEFDGLRLKYKVADFDCGIPMMNKDFQSILKSSQYPYLYLTIRSISIARDNTEIERLRVTSSVAITLAGETVNHEVKEGLVINYSETRLTLLGKDKLKMTDFDIEPPSRLFGLVQVTDELLIEFEIDMEVKTLKR